MDLPSVTFSSLLKEGIRQQAEEWKMQATISMSPEMKPESWKKFVSRLDEMTTDADILEVDSINKLKEIFGQK
jgi:uncharacterized protein (DUF2236 family)